MSDILPPLSGPKVDKILGKGSIALITDETLLALQPMRVNGVENCIYLMQKESSLCAAVHPGMPEREKFELLMELGEEVTGEALTMPMCHRSAKEAWTSAANMLTHLAAAAMTQANKASDAPALKPRHVKLRHKFKSKAKK